MSSPAPAVPRTLSTEALRSGYGGRVVVDGVDLQIPSARITVIVGANACGKSTLLKTMSRILAPVGGSVLLDGESLGSIPTRRLARRLGLLPQQPIAPEGITVADLVGRGRHPHQRAFRSWTARDREIVEEALVATRTAALADRSVDELSGGQRQRVWIAMALAQRTDVLLLDEPTTFLDLAHQVEVLDLLTDLNRGRGATIVMVLHDINLAARRGSTSTWWCTSRWGPPRGGSATPPSAAGRCSWGRAGPGCGADRPGRPSPAASTSSRRPSPSASSWAAMRRRRPP